MRRLFSLITLGTAATLLAFLAFGQTASADSATITMPGLGTCSYFDQAHEGKFAPDEDVVVSGATVEVDAYDIDPGDEYNPGEIDVVSLNGVVLGNLEGGNNADSTTTFTLTPAQFGSVFGNVVAGPVDLVVNVDVDALFCARIYEVRVIISYDAAITTPSTAAACKNGGWREYVDSEGGSFKNQGDCVSFVATGGRNLAGGQ